MQDQQLYAYLSSEKYNFLTHIANSNEKAEIVSSIIEMEKNKPVINVSLLKAIVAYIGEFNSSCSNKIELNLDNQAIFEMALNSAVNEEEKSHGDAQRAKRTILIDLMCYYESKYGDLLTESRNLRSYFLDHEFDHSNIKQYFTDLLNNISVSFDEIDSIQTINEHEEHLIHELNDCIPNQFEQFELQKLLPNFFLEFFESKKKEIQEAAKNRCSRLVVNLVSECIEQIKTFTFSFNTCKNIDSYSQELCQELQNLVDSNMELKAAEQILGTSFRSSPNIIRALSQKKREIFKAAADLKQIELGIINLEISFEDTFNPEAIETRRQHLLRELGEISNDFSQYTFIKQTIGNCDQKINDEATKAINKLEAKEIIHSSSFIEHLKILYKKVKKMEEWAQTDSDYREAAKSARELYTMNKAKNVFLGSGDAKEITLSQFESTCLRAIDTALLVLGVHRGWKEALAKIASVVLTITSFGVTYLATGRFWLFTPKTNSAQKVNNLKNEINNMLTKPSRSY
jgi:hypothetical protein